MPPRRRFPFRRVRPRHLVVLAGAIRLRLGEAGLRRVGRTGNPAGRCGVFRWKHSLGPERLPAAPVLILQTRTVHGLETEEPRRGLDDSHAGAVGALDVARQARRDFDR